MAAGRKGAEVRGQRPAEAEVERGSGRGSVGEREPSRRVKLGRVLSPVERGTAMILICVGCRRRKGWLWSVVR